MTDPDETLNTDQIQEPRQGGPFSVEPVDPLIFKQSSDSPEMRAAAAYIPVVKRRLRITDPKPTKPQQRDHDQWTPGSQDLRNPSPEQRQPAETDSTPAGARIGLRILTGLLILAPVGLIGAAVLFGFSLTQP